MVKILILFLCICTHGLNVYADLQIQRLEESTDVETLAFSNNELGLQVYAALKKDHQNLVFSPHNIAVALQMLYTGAGGITQSQMGRVLHYRFPPAQLEKISGELAQGLTTKHMPLTDEIMLLIANSLWIQKGRALLPAFEQTIKNSHKGIVKITDFQMQNAYFDINAWVKEQTRGKIADLLKAGDIHNTTRLLVVSAMYMQGRWQQPFDAYYTRQTPFFPYASKTLTVPMMTLTGDFSFVKEKAYSVVKLDYATKVDKPQLSMVVILSHATYGLEEVEKSLQAHDFDSMLSRMQKIRMVVSIPKFKMTSAIELKEALQSIGLTDPFATSADFSGIDGSYDLVVSNVLQKTFIAVEEKGTEAGVSSAIGVDAKSIQIKPKELFIADHPFLFFIIDNVSGSILFMGRVVSP